MNYEQELNGIIDSMESTSYGMGKCCLFWYEDATDDVISKLKTLIMNISSYNHEKLYLELNIILPEIKDLEDMVDECPNFKNGFSIPIQSLETIIKDLKTTTCT